MDHKQKLKSIPCPECDNIIKLAENIIIGSIVECPACAVESEIIEINPVVLSPLEEEK